jgi:hypothetical protein
MYTKENLLQAIEDGKLDSELGWLKVAVADRIKVRRAFLTVLDYPIGSKVVFNEKTGTRYMVGVTGTVVEHKVKKVVVQPDIALGRFDRGTEKAARTVCPIEILDLVS